VLLVMPRLPREIFKKILGDDRGIEFVGELDSANDLASLVRATGADFVVVDGDAGSASIVAFLRDYATLKLLTIEAAGDQISVYEFSPNRAYLGELSRETVRRALEEGSA
jgi:hypothetical protein